MMLTEMNNINNNNHNNNNNDNDNDRSSVNSSWDLNLFCIYMCIYSSSKIYLSRLVSRLQNRFFFIF
jgi:hypothetical protein